LKKLKLRIEAPPRRKHMVYLGASVLADLMRERNEEFWITRRQFEEGGLREAIQKMGKGVR